MDTMNKMWLTGSNATIWDGLESQKPFMVGRYGLTEGSVCWHKGILGKSLGKEIRHRLSWGVGLFPVNDLMIDDFILAQRSGALMADAMVEWGKHDWELSLLKATTGSEATRLHPYSLVAPFFIPDPWTDALEGLRVLVVHPFADSIIHQHDYNREEIGLLPDFDLEVVEAPMTFGGEAPKTEEGDTPPSDWTDVLDSLKDEVSDCDFDIALVGCGGYGLPLAGHIRAHGGKVILVGGGLQLLFGIRGRRWDNDERFMKLYNESWVRPLDHERPERLHKVEGGCYW